MKTPEVRRVERRLKRWLVGVAAALWPSRPIAPAEVELAKITRILVLRPHNERGDMLLMVPLLRALRECLPGRHLTLVASTVNESVVRRNPYVDRLLVLDARHLRRHPWKWLALVRELRRGRADLVVLPHTVSYSVTSALLARLAGAPIRVGTDSRSFGHAASRLALNVVQPHPPGDMHESLRNLAAVAALGITTSDLAPLYVPSREDEEFARRFLATLPAGSRLALLHVGAGKIPNRWPADRFGALAARIQTARLAEPVLAAGPGEEDLLREAEKSYVAHLPARAPGEAPPAPRAAPGETQCFVLRGRTLGEMAALSARAIIYVGNDTGPLHLAAAAGALTLALLGPTDPARWMPRTRRTRFIVAPEGSLAELTVETVWREVAEIASSSLGRT